MATGPHHRSAARAVLGAGMAVIMAAAGVVATGAGAQAAAPKDKIRPELAAQMAERGGGDFWIRFGAQADLSAASKIKDWNERGTAVAAAMKRSAASSQSGVRAELDKDGSIYQAFWATNAIKVSK